MGLKLKSPFRKVFIILSIVCNVLFLFLFLIAVSVDSSSLFVFTPPPASLPRLQSAFVISVPTENADIAFGPAEFTLKKDTEAAIQFSVLSDSAQSNLVIEPLYDHTVVSVAPTGFGITVKGLNPGETVLQVFSSGEFRDVAHIIVYE